MLQMIRAVSAHQSRQLNDLKLSCTLPPINTLAIFYDLSRCPSEHRMILSKDNKKPINAIIAMKETKNPFNF